MCESVFIEMFNSKKQKIIVGEVYRPPDLDVDKFNNMFELLLIKLDNEKIK